MDLLLAGRGCVDRVIEQLSVWGYQEGLIDLATERSSALQCA